MPCPPGAKPSMGFGGNMPSSGNNNMKPASALAPVQKPASSGFGFSGMTPSGGAAKTPCPPSAKPSTGFGGNKALHPSQLRHRAAAVATTHRQFSRASHLHLHRAASLASHSAVSLVFHRWVTTTALLRPIITTCHRPAAMRRRRTHQARLQCHRFQAEASLLLQWLHSQLRHQRW